MALLSKQLQTVGRVVANPSMGRMVANPSMGRVVSLRSNPCFKPLPLQGLPPILFLPNTRAFR